jgi:hypothetical protein
MKTRAEYDAEIARLQAERDALPPQPDLSEAVEAYRHAYNNAPGSTDDECRRAALIAAFPALCKAYGISAQPAAPVWPGEHEERDLACLAQFTGPYGSALHTPYNAALEMARRLREWQQANAAPEPTEAEDLAMAREVAAEHGRWTMYRPDDVRKGKHDDEQRVRIALAAIRAERRRARGGA